MIESRCYRYRDVNIEYIPRVFFFFNLVKLSCSCILGIHPFM